MFPFDGGLNGDDFGIDWDYPEYDLYKTKDDGEGDDDKYKKTNSLSLIKNFNQNKDFMSHFEDEIDLNFEFDLL